MSDATMELSDLEITRLCAEAMGFDALAIEQSLFDYDPLHDDAQAMALVKKLGLNAWWDGQHLWRVMGGPNDSGDAWASDLNRSICLCVARLQLSRESK